MPCPHYKLSAVSRGSRRNGKVRPAKLGGSAARRLQYIIRGGPYASRSNEVLACGCAGPDLGDWVQVDRREIRRDAIVAREIHAAISHTLSLAAQVSVAQAHAEALRREFGVAVKWSLHRASNKPGSDQRNVHVHFLLTPREVNDVGEQGEKTTGLDNRRTSGAAVATMRAWWQDAINQALVAAGSRERLDLRSFAARGISCEPQVQVPMLEFQRARRGEIYSPRYERNQALIALRTTTAAVAHATASFSRICRTLAAGIVLRRRASRTNRRRAASRSVDRARTQAFVARSGVSGNRGGANHAGDNLRSRPDDTTARAGLAHSVPAHKWSDDPLPAVDVGGASSGGRGGHSPATDRTPLAARADNPEPLVVAPPVATWAGLSLMTKIARWLGGGSRPEAFKPAHPTQSAASSQPRSRNEARTPAKGSIEHVDPADPPGDGAKRKGGEQEQTGPVEQISAVSDSQLPLLCVETQNGGRYFIKRQDWSAACADRATNVPTCNGHGDPVLPGEKTFLRRTTIEKSKRTPTPIVNVDAYMLSQEQDQERGLSTDM